VSLLGESWFHGRVRSKVVSRSSAESKYRAMANAVCELIWINQFMAEVGLETEMPVQLWCDN